MTSEVLAPLTKRGVPIDPTLRVLAAGTFVNRAGSGALVTVFALFFTRKVGLEPSQIGVALSVGAFVGMLTQVPFGHLGDIRGPREVMRGLMFVTGLLSLTLLVIRDFWLLILLMAVFTGVEAGANGVRNGYIARIATGGQGVRFKAYLRAITNVAIGIGALLGGLALAVDETWAYLSVIALDGIGTIGAGLLYASLPHIPPAPERAEGEPRLGVLRDLPYVVVTLLAGIIAMHFVIIEVGIPLWVAEHTAAPKSMVAVLLVLNTAAVALFQVRLARGSDKVMSSVKLAIYGAAMIAGGFAIISFASGVGRTAAILILLVGSGVHVVGEMLTSGASWGVSMGLAPVERQGQYQGFAGLGFSIANVAAPTLTTLLCIEWGRPGWFILGGLILSAALLNQPVCAWALRTREKYGAATASG
ncbi:MFS transporter [Nocardioides marmorisolisilvae]|uniref:MFS transporter n=1 Tax=Nocardioides marmorisolisilvae TaxID=1542737 RepID=A0A3N0DS59_9ACTN|nr:MFS transporter [Nocardioides marmorisolisilvae]RNL78462.1 MFS transporter [Nocardioides marmorisolisilvae]